MSKYFFVDYENVGTTSLMGIENLHPDDELVIVITKNEANIVNIKLLKKLSKAIPNMTIVINNIETHDAADFRLITEIGVRTRYIRKSKDQIYILSEDKGFNVAIEGFKNAGYDIEKMDTIASVYASKIDYKKSIHYLASKIHKYGLLLSQFNDHNEETIITNQKVLIKIIYLMYMSNRSLDKFQSSLISAGFNGYVVNSLIYIVGELIHEGLY